MTKARRDIIDTDVTRYYHCISSCVRQGFHCGFYGDLRRLWLRRRLKKLVRHFSLDVCAFSFLSSHFHVIVRLNPRLSAGWSPKEVVRRWSRVCHPRDSSNRKLEVTDEWIEEQARDQEHVAELRSRLDDLGWFMRLLKQPIAQKANKEDRVFGHFWSGRYRSIPIMSEFGLAKACAYVDLNPFSAGETTTPEGSRNSSIFYRLRRFRSRRMVVLSVNAPGHQSREGSQWLCPIESWADECGKQEGMFAELKFEDYLALFEVTSRRVRKGNKQVNESIDTVQDRWDLDLDNWTETLARTDEYFFGTSELASSNGDREGEGPAG